MEEQEFYQTLERLGSSLLWQSVTNALRKRRILHDPKHVELARRMLLCMEYRKPLVEFLMALGIHSGCCDIQAKKILAASLLIDDERLEKALHGIIELLSPDLHGIVPTEDVSALMVRKRIENFLFEFDSWKQRDLKDLRQNIKSEIDDVGRIEQVVLDQQAIDEWSEPLFRFRYMLKNSLENFEEKYYLREKNSRIGFNENQLIHEMLLDPNLDVRARLRLQISRIMIPSKSSLRLGGVHLKVFEKFRKRLLETLPSKVLGLGKSKLCNEMKLRLPSPSITTFQSMIEYLKLLTRAMGDLCAPHLDISIKSLKDSISRFIAEEDLKRGKRNADEMVRDRSEFLFEFYNEIELNLFEMQIDTVGFCVISLEKCLRESNEARSGYFLQVFESSGYRILPKQGRISNLIIDALDDCENKFADTLWLDRERIKGWSDRILDWVSFVASFFSLNVVLKKEEKEKFCINLGKLKICDEPGFFYCWLKSTMDESGIARCMGLVDEIYMAKRSNRVVDLLYKRVLVFMEQFVEEECRVENATEIMYMNTGNMRGRSGKNRVRWRLKQSFGMKRPHPSLCVFCGEELLCSMGVDIAVLAMDQRICYSGLYQNGVPN